MSTERISGTFGTITFRDYGSDKFKGVGMTQDNGMSVQDVPDQDACLHEQLDKYSAEVNVLIEQLMQSAETIKEQQQQIDYLEYLITRKAAGE